MLRRRCPLAVLLSLTIASVVWRMDAAPTLVAAQTTGSTVSPARAAPFMGDWTAPITSQMGPMTFAISVKVEGGNVVATVSGGVFPTATVSDISLVGQNLFLKYASDFQGMHIPGLVAMTPKGQDMLLTISLTDGQFEVAGTATKGGAAGPSAISAGRGQTGRGAAPPAQAGGRGPGAQPQVARVTDVMQMMSALPESAPATPKQPRTVLVLAKAAGFVHSSIPLATRTIEAVKARAACSSRSSATTNQSTRCRRCWRTSWPACSTRSVISRPTTTRRIRQSSEDTEGFTTRGAGS